MPDCHLQYHRLQYHSKAQVANVKVYVCCVLQLFTDTANALPAEIPLHMKQQRRPAKGQHVRRSCLQSLRLPGTNRCGLS